MVKLDRDAFFWGSKPPDTNINRYSGLISRQTGACLFGSNLISKYVSIFVICFTPIKKWMKIQLKTNCKNKQKKPLYQLIIPTSPTGYSLPVSHFSSSHFDHRLVDNNSICYNSNPHSCQGHPLASDRERGCAGSRNPDKLSWAYEDFSLASPPQLTINLISLQTGGKNTKLTTNWEAVINSSATYIPTQIPMIHSLSSVKSQALTEDLRSAWKDVWCAVQQKTHDTYLPEFKSQRQNKALLKTCHPETLSDKQQRTFLPLAHIKQGKQVVIQVVRFPQSP